MEAEVEMEETARSWTTTGTEYWKEQWAPQDLVVGRDVGLSEADADLRRLGEADGMPSVWTGRL